MNQLTKVFNYGESEVRTIVKDDEVWFIAKDVCEVLELSDVSMSVKRLDEDEKLVQTLFVSGQNRQIMSVNESGLYELIFTSRKSEAKEFKKWVKSDVLPSIRKTGSYEQPKSQAQLALVMAEQLVSHEQRLEKVETVVNERITLDHGQQTALHHQIKVRIESIFSDYEEQYTKQKLYSQLHSHLRRAFQAPKYIFVKSKDFNEAINWVKAWRPML